MSNLTVIIALFLSGVVTGVIVVVALAVRREDRWYTLAEEYAEPDVEERAPPDRFRPSGAWTRSTFRSASKLLRSSRWH